ncbi:MULTISPECIES: NfeD family protein [Marinobacter]|uniref:Nodulation efficiency, NfeD-like protein n=1 Tax=Marinobacter profundi TaxID=2666256 RepID=A0A2G1ULB9_9GAMM|nr:MULTISPECIES: nodulation efficiency, NfeD-like protein [Marinobacter]MBD3658426.1 nodulation efficiency, NfeD-like protein [Marinobacter sp.]PHQ15291.1 nodulation efficiency, NfeD-like protein [Marinobacter profundi]
MEWSLTHFWLILALVLSLAELTSGVLLLLALGVAAALTALVAFLGAPFEWQLVAMGVLSGILVPVAIRWIRPRFSPKGVAYGTTGTGVEHGRRYHTLQRDFDGATGIKVNGDFYRLKLEDGSSPELPEGTPVIFEQFDGTTAIVHLANHHKEQ